MTYLECIGHIVHCPIYPIAEVSDTSVNWWEGSVTAAGSPAGDSFHLPVVVLILSTHQGASTVTLKSHVTLYDINMTIKGL